MDPTEDSKFDTTDEGATQGAGSPADASAQPQDETADAETISDLDAYFGRSRRAATVDGKGEGDPDETGSDTDAGDGDTSGAADDALSGFDPATIEAARRMTGRSDDDLRQALRDDREAALRIINLAAETQRNITSEFGRRGNQRPPSDEGQRDETPQDGEQRDPEFDAKITALKQKLSDSIGDEDTASELVDSIAELVAPLQKTVRQSEEQSAQRAFIETAERAFSSLPEAKAIYGEGPTPQTTGKQREARQRTAQLAEVLEAGAKAKGGNMPLDAAFAIAHQVIASEHLQTSARSKDQAQRREKQRTIPPGGRKVPERGSKVMLDDKWEVDADALEKTEADIASYFGS